MPTWNGIEDASPIAEKVWFSRLKEGEPWKPLRRSDCIQMNQQQQDEVVIECGRATADLVNKKITYNFSNIPERELCSAIWFLAESRSEKDIRLTPIGSEKDESAIENLYQRALKGATSLGSTDAVLKEEAELVDDDKFKVIIAKIGNSLRLRKRPKSAISLEGSSDLQRGYGEYVVDGEEEEISLGPVRHLSFVIHGIGEAMWKREDVNIPGTIESVEAMRSTLNKKMYESWKQECNRCNKQNRPIPQPPNRIELIPIEWYDKIHSKSSTLKNQLLSTTLQTIPKLRAIANDVLFDVLMYMTPVFCEEVLICVTEQIIHQYSLFKAIHADYDQEGSVSLIGHSLGSVITWDLLSILGNKLNEKVTIPDTASISGSGTVDDPIEIELDDNELKSYRLPQPTNAHASGVYKAYAGDSDVQQGSGTWGPSLEKGVEKTLPFVPKFTFFLGSPLGLFLTLRGARPLFDKMRQHVNEDKGVSTGDKEKDEEKEVEVKVEDLEMVSPFSLPSGAIYNIFHPSDPIAYRIEPLLMPMDFDDSNLPAPAFLVLDGQGLRFHVMAKEISDSVFRSISGLFKTSVLDKIPDESTGDGGKGSGRPKSRRGKKDTKWDFKLGGDSERVDFQLQPGRLDNEYLSAISAHSSYWLQPDLMDFLMQCAQD